MPGISLGNEFGRQERSRGSISNPGNFISHLRETFVTSHKIDSFTWYIVERFEVKLIKQITSLSMSELNRTFSEGSESIDGEQFTRVSLGDIFF